MHPDHPCAAGRRAPDGPPSTRRVRGGQKVDGEGVGSDANNVTFLPAVDWDTGLMDGMNDIDGDALLGHRVAIQDRHRGLR